MAPIRIAIVGLSSSAKTSWASLAHLPYLLSPRGKASFSIVALCNSSVEAAQSAIKHYNLPSETRAYGDPETLANDQDVELVVVCTRVDVHYSSILPSLKAGKQALVEWPLAHNTEHARILEAAVQPNTAAFVGLQGRLAPPVVKIRELLHEGRIGKVLSSEVFAAGGLNDRVILPAWGKYFTQKAVGGNVITIGLGHLFDQVQHVLGKVDNFKSHAQIQRPQVKLKDASNNITETVTSDVPDLIYATGTLNESSISQHGAGVFFRFRRGQPFPNHPPLVWTINGEKGEIKLTAHDGTTLHATAIAGPVTIEVHDFESDTVDKVDWAWQPWQEELPVVARSVAAVYEAIAAKDTEALATFGDAAVRTEQLTTIIEG